MNQLNLCVNQLNSFVWGVPLIILLVGTGLYLTIRLRLVQLFGLGHGLSVVSGRYDNHNDPGEISHFQALTTALSATIGTGNIVGVAAAILMGGPGAVFWMWMTACVGMATKFACCTLSIHYRRVSDDGEVHAGPMHYIELGMGHQFKWLAILFAVFTAIASFGIGNMFQVSNITTSLGTLVYGADSVLPRAVEFNIGLGVAFLVGLVILGGIKRIAVVASKLVPFMCFFYIAAGLIILIKNYTLIPDGLHLIFTQAFVAPEAVAGGLLGGVIRSGVARGLFSNEAGLGSAAIAHGAAQTTEPVREGLVAMLGPLIDTIIVCSITALVIISTGAHKVIDNKGLLTSSAFEIALPGSGIIVSIGIILFAFSTLIAWSYYGDRAVDYLFGKKAVVPYRLSYIVFIVVGSVNSLDTIISFSDAMNGLMAIPNLIALVVLSPVLVRLTNQYFAKQKDTTSSQPS